jgi:hypothetical protein
MTQKTTSVGMSIMDEDKDVMFGVELELLNLLVP